MTLISCPQCNLKICILANYCPNCGTSLAENVAPTRSPEEASVSRQSEENPKSYDVEPDQTQETDEKLIVRVRYLSGMTFTAFVVMVICLFENPDMSFVAVACWMLGGLFVGWILVGYGSSDDMPFYFLLGRKEPSALIPMKAANWRQAALEGVYCVIATAFVFFVLYIIIVVLWQEPPRGQAVGQ